MADKIKNLVIVESPAKAKTIEKYLGKEFTVRSSMGHIRDLKKGDGAIDTAAGYTPMYEVTPDKKTLVAELKKLAGKAETIWLATDEDREGEAISWHLFEVLGLKDSSTRRIVFNEITKPAIEHAVQNPRTIDRHLVDAQQARRVLDRLVGYELSPVLWKKVKPSLSAGRVQSVAVRLIVDREREINDFTSRSDFRISAEFETATNKKIKAALDTRFASEEEAASFLQSCIPSQFRVASVEVKPAFRSPAPPFTTSTLQQEASRKLGFSVAQTMQVAQRLYENGHITYMRTDSVNLSKLAIGAAAQEITKVYGKEFSQPRNYTTKNESAQEAHEAIRPTYFNEHSAGSDLAERKLYDLIWKRSIASQMSKAELEKTIITIEGSGLKARFIAEGEVIRFEGFLKVYVEGLDDSEDDEQSALLPKVAPNETLIPLNISATQKYNRPAPRYTEASLVKKMEELGIGRPSTYAPTISTIQKRAYVEKASREGTERAFTVLSLSHGSISRTVKSEITGQEKNKLFPTDIGILVTDFLAAHFPEIMDFGFTASVEKDFDEIADGKTRWVDMIDDFYKPFQVHVQKTLAEADRVTGERILGTDPKTGHTILVRMGRFGPLVQIGSKTETSTPQFASLQKDQSLEHITLEAALDLFKLPREITLIDGLPVVAALGKYGPYLRHDGQFYAVPKGTDLLAMTPEEAAAFIMAARNAPKLPIDLGEMDGVKVQVNKGRFGPYVKLGNLFVTIPKGEDMFSITLERAKELIADKAKAEAAKIIKTFAEDKDVQVLKGRYGPYLAKGRDNFMIPKGQDPETLTWEQAQALMASGAGKKKTTKAAASSIKPAAVKAKGTAKKTTTAKGGKKKS